MTSGTACRPPQSPPPSGWQLSDWVNLLDVESMVLSAIVDRVLAVRRHARSQQHGSSWPHTDNHDGLDLDPELITLSEVLQLQNHDLSEIAVKTGRLVGQALEQQIIELKDTKRNTSSETDAGTTKTDCGNGAGGVSKFVLAVQHLEFHGEDAGQGGGGAGHGGGGGGRERGAGQGYTKTVRTVDHELFRRLWVQRVGLVTCEETEVLMQMQEEHISSADSRQAFAVGEGSHASTTTCRAEWEYVVGPKAVNADGTLNASSLPIQPAGAKHGTRKVAAVVEYLQKREAIRAGLNAPEVTALRLWSGPMHIKYAVAMSKLANEGVKGFRTTIAVLVSALIKLRRVQAGEREQGKAVSSRRDMRNLAYMLAPRVRGEEGVGGVNEAEDVKGTLRKTVKRDMWQRDASGLRSPPASAAGGGLSAQRMRSHVFFA
jgi:hypothetical protein